MSCWADPAGLARQHGSMAMIGKLPSACTPGHPPHGPPTCYILTWLGHMLAIRCPAMRCAHHPEPLTQFTFGLGFSRGNSMSVTASKPIAALLPRMPFMSPRGRAARALQRLGCM